MKDGKIQWNRRFAPETIALIEVLAKLNRRSDANMVEVLVANAAAEQGVTVPSKRRKSKAEEQKVDSAAQSA